jgi:hypothetical protein
LRLKLFFSIRISGVKVQRVSVKLEIPWKPHNVITLGQRESDDINQMITKCNCLLIQSTYYFMVIWDLVNLEQFDHSNWMITLSVILASSHGLVVKEDNSWPRGPGFKPPLWRPFFRHHSFGSKLGTKVVESSNLAMLHVL